MIYLRSFSLPSDHDENKYLSDFMPEYEWVCYSGSVYPFGVFSGRGLKRLEFRSSVTVLCGENGSGKSTLLNVMAEKLGISRSTPFNNSPCFSAYTDMCSYEFEYSTRSAPEGSAVVTSDSVFDFLLDCRAVNNGIKASREAVFETYSELKADMRKNGYIMSELSEYDELKKRNEIRRTSLPQYVKKRVNKDVILHSNGESALDIFERAIKSNAIYLLDEPENSLSAAHQRELAGFISDSARFYNCQFIISSHSPFILSLKEAEIYDLDRTPVQTSKWSELSCVKEYASLFIKRSEEFK